MNPPELQISREGKSNFEDIRAWAKDNLGTWKLVERMRVIHHWTDIEFLEILAAHLALQLHDVTETRRKLAGLPLPVEPPDPVPPTLFQEAMAPPSRAWAIVYTAAGLALAIAGAAVHAKGGHPWFAYPMGAGSLVFLVAGYLRRV